MNWPDCYAWLVTQPAGKARDSLLRLASTKVKISAPKLRLRLPRGQKRESLPGLKKELDRVFSIFVRLRDSDPTGIGACRTCGRTGHWTDMDAGHYVPRQDLIHRWNPKNVHLQCKPCNGFRGGEPEKMAEYIDRTYGKGTARGLKDTVWMKFRYDRHWMRQGIAEYSSLIDPMPKNKKDGK